MIKLHARKMLDYSNEQLWDLLKGEFILVMDDGEIKTNSKEVIYSHFIWRYHKEYRNTPLLMKHHVKAIVKNSLLTRSTHQKLITSVFWDVANTYGRDIKLIDHLCKIAYEVSTEIYNVLTVRTPEYVVSLDILDFLQFNDISNVTAALEEVNPNHASIKDCYNKLETILKDPILVKDNPIALSIQTNTSSLNQVLQCVGPRGYLTDMDSTTFQTPILRGYFAGMRSLHDLLIESRSAAKALWFSKENLQNSQYSKRRLEFLGMYVDRLHMGDCGSDQYLSMLIKPPVYAQTISGEVVKESDGDLPNLVGKYFLDTTTNSLKEICKTDTHLIGQTVKLRSPVAGCYHPDLNGICSTCFGALSYSISEGSNVGHACVVELMSLISQKILSTKHLDSSAMIDPITIASSIKHLFKTSKDGYSYHLSDELLQNETEVSLVVVNEEVYSLEDVFNAEDVYDIVLSRVSELTEISVRIKADDSVTYIPVVVNINNRKANFTYEFLEYIKSNKPEIDARGNYVFSLDNWTKDDPLITVPQKQYNMSDHANLISKLIEARIKDLTDRGDSYSAARTLLDLYELVNAQLDINIAVLEVIIYSSMIRDPGENDFRLPKKGTKSCLGVSKLTINKRSLGPAMAYQEQIKELLSPNSFLDGPRNNHSMDVYLTPKEMIEDMKRK